MIKQFAALFMIFFIISSISIADTQDHTVTLEEAIQIAYQNNQNLIAARAKGKIAKLNISKNKGNFLPQLEFEQMVINTDQQVAAFGTKLTQGSITQENFNPVGLNDPERISDFATAIKLSQPLFNGGREYLGFRLAQVGYEKNQEETRTAEEHVIFNTVKSYLGAILAREGLRVSESAVATGQKNVEMIQRQFENGLVIKSDFLQANVHLAELKERSATAKSRYRIALAALNTIMGERNLKYHPSDQLNEMQCPEVDLSTLINWGLKDRPELKAMDFQEKWGDLQLRLAQSSFLPDLNFQGTYEYHGGDLLSEGADAMTFALSLKLNIFNGMSDYFEVRKARTQMEVIQESKLFYENKVKLEVQTAYYDILSAEERIKSTTQAVSQAEEGLRIIAKRYQSGTSGIVDLLRAELAVSNARFNRLQAKHDLLLSHNSLCKAVGHIYTRWLEPEKCPVPPVRISDQDGNLL